MPRTVVTAGAAKRNPRASLSLGKIANLPEYKADAGTAAATPPPADTHPAQLVCLQRSNAIDFALHKQAILLRWIARWLAL